MSLEQSVYDLLRNDAGVTAIVSQRISAVTVPELETLPALCYSTVALVPNNNVQGTLGRDQARFQIDSYSNTYEEAKSIAVAVRTAMVANNFALLLLEIDLYEDQPRIYHVVQDFSVWS